MTTQDWKPTGSVKALVIGHDPRLKNSDTIAPFALFADYYFRDVPTNTSEKRKYGLAKATFDHIIFLTYNKIKPENIYITNLCNEALPHAPLGKMVYIPMEYARKGLENIKVILNEYNSIEYIFPMSLQVNYWLQKLGFYTSDSNFLKLTEPQEKGLISDPQYFEPKNVRTFQQICGNIYTQESSSCKIVPILHSIQFPLNRITSPKYGPAYEKIRNYFHSQSNI